MRRTREISFGHYVAIAVPVIAAAWGAYSFVKHQRNAGQALHSSHSSTVPSHSSSSASHTTGTHATVTRGEDHDADHESDHAPDHAPDHATVEHKAPSAHDVHGARAVASGKHVEAAHAASHTTAHSTAKPCTPLEYRGDSPDRTKITRTDWTIVINQFHAAKDSLISWLKNHRAEIPESTYTLMERQVRNLRIQRPPAVDEPDLAWRGIGVYIPGTAVTPQVSAAAAVPAPAPAVQVEPATGMVRIGGGFVKLANSDSIRARFEMTRLVAQSWAPCELQRLVGVGGAPLWGPLLTCLGVADRNACADGSYSEAGWAISTTVAAQISPPACEVSAYQSPETNQCLRRIPLATANVEAKGEASYALNGVSVKGGRQ